MPVFQVRPAVGIKVTDIGGEGHAGGMIAEGDLQEALAQAIDAKDHYTHSHSENVVKYAVAIAEEMRLPLGQIEILREACELVHRMQFLNKLRSEAEAVEAELDGAL